MKRKFLIVWALLLVLTFFVSAGVTLTVETNNWPCEFCPNCPQGPCWYQCDGCCIYMPGGKLACLY